MELLHLRHYEDGVEVQCKSVEASECDKQLTKCLGGVQATPKKSDNADPTYRPP